MTIDDQTEEEEANEQEIRRIRRTRSGYGRQTAMTTATKTRTLYVGTQPDPADRLQIDVDKEDDLKVKALKKAGAFVTVLDLRTNRLVTVKRADCGLDCACALELVEWMEQSPPRTHTCIDSNNSPTGLFCVACVESRAGYVGCSKCGRAHDPTVSACVGPSAEVFPSSGAACVDERGTNQIACPECGFGWNDYTQGQHYDHCSQSQSSDQTATTATDDIGGKMYWKSSRQTKRHIHTCMFCGQSGTELSNWTQPAPDTGEWVVECQKVLVADPPRGRVVIKDTKTLRVIVCEDNPVRWEQALIDFDQIVSEHNAVAKLVEALLFVDTFLQNLEDIGEENDPITAARRRYHKPIREKIDAALTTLRNNSVRE